MKKKILFGLLLFVLFVATSCNNPRDIKEMLQEKGYKSISVTKVDSLKWLKPPGADAPGGFCHKKGSVPVEQSLLALYNEHFEMRSISKLICSRGCF